MPILFFKKEHKNEKKAFLKMKESKLYLCCSLATVGDNVSSVEKTKQKEIKDRFLGCRGYLIFCISKHFEKISAEPSASWSFC